MTDKTRVLVADPPWKFGDKLPGPKRGAESHYRVMTTPEIMRFPLPPLADDALLLMWRVAAMPLDALKVAEAWGFTPKSEIVWVKTPANSTEEGRLAFGMGHYVRAAHEVCLVATRGRFKVADRAVRSVFFAPRGRHSAKPGEFYALAQKLGGAGPYAELFARTPRPGWLQVGDELPAVVTP